MIFLDRVNVCQWRRKIKTFFSLVRLQGILQAEKKTHLLSLDLRGEVSPGSVIMFMFSSTASCLPFFSLH